MRLARNDITATGSVKGRVRLQGDVLIWQGPNALCLWAYEGQVGTIEACDDPQLARSNAREILLQAKEQG